MKRFAIRNDSGAWLKAERTPGNALTDEDNRAALFQTEFNAQRVLNRFLMKAGEKERGFHFYETLTVVPVEVTKEVTIEEIES